MIKTVLALSLSMIASAAFAQAGHDMSHMNHMAPATADAAAPAQGEGTIRKIDAKAGTLTLQHAPIAALNWPSMTMPFKASPELLKGFKVGQKVSFSVVAGSPPEVTAMSAQ